MRIWNNGKKICVVSPYNALFIDGARKLGGKYNTHIPENGWTFDPRDEERVRDLCMDVYGSDGEHEDLCTLRVEFIAEDNSHTSPLTVHGRKIASAFGRDSGAKLGDGVILISGHFSSSGSMKNWYTTARPGTIVLVRDFPRKRALTLPSDATRVYSVYEEENTELTKLKKEKERLENLLKEVNERIALEEEKIQTVV